MPITYLAPEENIDDILYTPAAAPTRNLGPGINLANPFGGVSDFGTKTVSEPQGDYAVDVDVPRNVVDYLIANNPTIADALGHSSTFVKTYQNVNGQLVEVDPGSITPQAAASGNVVFQIGGKTGGPDRERVAQVYVPKGNELIPVGEGQFYKGEHPDQALFDFAKMAAIAAGAIYLGPMVAEAIGGAGAAAGADLGGLAALGEGAGSGSLASNLTVGEAASTITNPMQIVTKPITNTITDYVVNAINSAGSALPSVAVGDATSLGLTTISPTTYAAIKTGVGAVVNGVASELLGGDFKEGAVGTLVSTALNKVPIPGTADLLKTNQDLPFNSFIGELVGKGLDATGLTTNLSNRIADGVAKGTTAGVTTWIAGGDSDAIYRNTGLGAIMGAFGDTKIPGTKLTGDDALELIQNSFAEGADGSNALNNAAGRVLVNTQSDPLDQFDPDTYINGAGSGGSKSTGVTGGSGNDAITTKPTREAINKAYVEVLGRAGDDAGLDYWVSTGAGLDDIINALKGSDEYKAKKPSVSVTGARDSIDDTISDYIDLGGYNDLITSGSGNDSINAGAVEVKSVSDPCENPNQIRDPITGSCYDPIDYVALGGSGNDKIDAGTVTVTAADCNKIGMDYDPIENKCIERVDISKLPTVKPKTPTPPPTTTTRVVDTFCKPPKIRDNVNGGCVCPPGYVEQGDDCIEPAKVTVTASDCYAQGKGYNPQTNSCFDLEYTTINLTGGTNNDSVNKDTCPIKGEVRGADGICRPQLEVTAKKCNEDQYKGADGNCYCLDPDQAPNALGLCQDTTSDVITVRGGGGNDTVRGGGGNDTITGDGCPTGYTRNAKTGECEFNLVGLPSLFTNLTSGGNGPASYTPNLTQPFTASRTYKAPPATYDYAGADTVGYEDPYFQRFGPITYTPPAGYLGAGVLPSPAGGTDTDTVDGAGVDTSGGGNAEGGLLSLARGGRTLPPRYLGGITDGMADRVPAHIDGKRPAALSDGEFVIPADVVSHLGNGNSSAGAKILYEMMDRVRKARTGTKKQGREIDAQRFMPR